MKKLTWFALIWAAVYFFLDFFVSSEAAESARSWVMWIVGPIVILIILKDLMEQTIKRCVKEEYLNEEFLHRKREEEEE